MLLARFASLRIRKALIFVTSVSSVASNVALMVRSAETRTFVTLVFAVVK
jgi:hypothetical protein